MNEIAEQELLNQEETCPPPTEEEPQEAPDPTEELAALREELARVRSALAEQEALTLRLENEAKEKAEFLRLFPGVDPDSLPEEVLTSHAQGIPLAAAFALYEKQREVKESRVAAVNRRNAERASGRAGTGTTEEFFTPEEVRRMSAREVRTHFKTIRESMKQWN